MSPKLRVLIADDALLVREGIRAVLETGGIAVVHAVGDAESMFAVLGTTASIDAVVLDVRMPPTYTDEGVRALERIRREGWRVGVLLLSMYGSTEMAYRTAAAGAGTGYLLKDRVTEESTLVDAVRTVAAHGTVLDEDVVQSLIANHRGSLRSRLTDREREVLALIAAGLSNARIAAVLQVSVKTVEAHFASIAGKAGVDPDPDLHRRVLLVLQALRGIT